MIRSFLIVALISSSTVSWNWLETALADHIPINEILEKVAAQGTGGDPEGHDQQCGDCGKGNDITMTRSMKLATEGTGSDPPDRGGFDTQGV